MEFRKSDFSFLAGGPAQSYNDQSDERFTTHFLSV